MTSEDNNAISDFIHSVQQRAPSVMSGGRLVVEWSSVRPDHVRVVFWMGGKTVDVTVIPSADRYVRDGINVYPAIDQVDQMMANVSRAAARAREDGSR